MVGCFRGGTLVIALYLLIDDVLTAENAANLDPFRPSFSVYSIKQVHSFQSIRSNALPILDSSCTRQLSALQHDANAYARVSRKGRPVQNPSTKAMQPKVPQYASTRHQRGKLIGHGNGKTRGEEGVGEDVSSSSPQIQLRAREGCFDA
jgi:hypothetical protein